MACNDFDNDSENDLPFNNFSREESSQEKETNTENDVLSVQAKFHEWPVTIQITQKALWSLLGILKPIVETLYKIHEP